MSVRGLTANSTGANVIVSASGSGSALAAVTAARRVVAGYGSAWVPAWPARVTVPAASSSPVTW
ncbi:MAG: hypothetical protein U0746_22185 [Gemmataceae bacterium]